MDGEGRTEKKKKKTLDTERCENIVTLYINTIKGTVTCEK
jgi:hypothetical protein